jgi:hypothetical protein
VAATADARHLHGFNQARAAERTGRNEPCPCGSGFKHKRCCLTGGPITETQVSTRLPGWLLNSRRKLHQFEKYICDVYRLPRLLASLTDGRREAKVPTFDVVNSLFHTAVLRIPSINALEGNLREADFQRLIGRKSKQDLKAFSADVVANVLDKLDLGQLDDNIAEVIGQAERNKAFRDGSYGGLRCVAIDGWEPFSSYHRHCSGCLVRQVERKRASGEVENADQYYHRYVVALLIGPLLDVVVGIEPVRNKQTRIDGGEKNVECDEGELTAAHRLLGKLHTTYGTFIDAFVFDGLYPNGPLLTKLTKLKYGALIVLRKEDNEPLKDALALWEGQPPCEVVDDPETKEHIEYWDVDELETLDTYKGKIRVIRAEVTKRGPRPTTSTWCAAIIGERPRRLSVGTALKAVRARWHIENTAFHQWVSLWNLSHVFRHTDNALLAVLLLWSLAFNLLQLFVYRRLKRPRRPKDPTDTIRHIVEMMLRDVATLPESMCWEALFESG